MEKRRMIRFKNIVIVFAFYLIFHLNNYVYATSNINVNISTFTTVLNSDSLTQQITLVADEEIISNGVNWKSSNENVATVELISSDETTQVVMVTAKNEGNAVITATVNNYESEEKKCYVTVFSEDKYNQILNNEIKLNYGLFGAKGDGITDDFEPIRAAHEFANNIYSSKRLNLTVYGESDKTYYIGAGTTGKSIDVKTNVDWDNCNFFIDDYVDKDLDGKNDVSITNPIFVVRSSKSTLQKSLQEIRDVQTEFQDSDFYLNEQTTKMEWLADYLKTQRIGSYGYKNLYILVTNKNLQYYRNGTSSYNVMENFIISMDETNFGEIKGQVNNNIIRAEDFQENQLGNIQIIAYPMDDDELIISNGKFLTYTNNEVYDENGNKSDYTKRGIQIYRNNVTIDNIVHTIDENKHLNENSFQDKATGNLYYGFLYSYCSMNLTIKNCKLMPHTYTTRNSVSNGTYDLTLDRTMNIKLENVGYACVCSNESTNDNQNTYCDTCYASNITDDSKWGIMASNLIKNLDIDNCILNRIDSHQGVWDLNVRNTTVGVKGFTLNGGGMCLIEDVTIDSSSQIITLRTDYGANWKGTIELKNIQWIVKQGENDPRIMLAKNSGSLNYGYNCYFPDLKIYNLTIDNSDNEGKNTRIYIINLQEPTSKNYAYGFYGNIDLKNIVNAEKEKSDFCLKIADMSSEFTRYLLSNYSNTSSINFKIQNVQSLLYDETDDTEENIIKKYNAINNTIFNVTKILNGDADGDLAITAYDAYKTLVYSLEDNIEDEIIYLLDMDGDNMLTAFDAYMILKKSIEMQ